MTRAAVTVLWYLVFQQHMKGFEPSPFGKFFDDEPHAPMSVALRQLLLEELKNTVARDIEPLLNMHIVSEGEDLHGLPECKRSLLMYGLNDFSDLSLTSFYDYNHICQPLARAIERHEPRSQHVNVSLEVNKRATNALCFGISVVLLVGPACEPVNFDTMLQPSTLRHSVSCGRG